MPLISAIIPTWNRSAYVLEAVASVRAQSFADWELIVVDDGSSDGTAARLARLGDARIRVLERPHDGNVARVRNAGASAARAPWLAFLDSDDVWHPHKLAVQHAATTAAGTRWSYTGYALMDAHHGPLPFRRGVFRPLCGDILPALLTLEANVSICTLMVEKRLFEEVEGFDSANGGLRSDYDFMLRIAARAPAHAVDRVLTRMRDHDARMTAGLSAPHEATAYIFERFLGREREPALRRLARRTAASLLLEGAAWHAGHARPALAASLLLRSVRHRPAPHQWLRTLGGMGLRLFRRAS